MQLSIVVGLLKNITGKLSERPKGKQQMDEGTSNE